MWDWKVQQRNHCNLCILSLRESGSSSGIARILHWRGQPDDQADCVCLCVCACVCVCECVCVCIIQTQLT